MPVRYLTSQFGGVPRISQTAGSLITVLDGALVHGFDLGTISEIVVSGGTATATVPDGTFCGVGMVLNVVGAAAGLAGYVTVTSNGPTTFSWSTTATAGTYTGAGVSVRMPPLDGWSKPFSGTNLGAYKSNANGYHLRVDNTSSPSASYALVAGYSSMTGISTGVNEFRLAGSWPSYWYTASAASTQRDWVIVGDERFFYYAVAGEGGTQFWVGAFGEFTRIDPNDNYPFLLSANTDAEAVLSQHLFRNQTPLSYSGSNFARNWNGTIINSPVLARWPAITNNLDWPGRGGLAYPSPMDGGLSLTQQYLVERTDTSRIVRGTLPGLYLPLSNVQSTIVDREILTGLTSHPGRTFRTMASTSDTTWVHRFTVFFDITGPWR